MKKSEDKTRALVARALLENGPLSAAQLSDLLDLTPAGIRRHLDALISSGALEAKEPYRTAASVRGRGRPSKVFVLTDSGRTQFEHTYDDLAVSALTFMRTAGSGEMLREFALERANEITRRVAPKGNSSRAKIEGLADSLTAQGYAATIKSTAIGIELCQHHCPIAHVASEFSELCSAETAAFSALLGTHVQRLATIAHGDGVCTTFIPASANQSSNSEHSTAKGR